MPQSAAALVQAKVDVIVAYGSTAVFTAAKTTKQIPIVIHMGADPVAGGLVASLARPGGNITGVVTLATGLTAKRIELLKELNPNVSSVGVLLAPNVTNPDYVRESQAAARTLNLEVHFAEARGPEEIESRLGELQKSRVAAISVTASSMLASHSARVVAAVAKHELPAVYAVERYVEAGGLITYSPSVRKTFARAAGYVDRVLRGARPGELAIEQASDFELTVNLKTAKALGIRIPQSILVRAERVIE